MSLIHNYRHSLPSISQLAAFESVGRLKSFTRAATELNVAQPNISRHLKSLEEEFGCQLIERSPHSVELTLDGQQLYGAVVAGLGQIANVIQSIKRGSRKSVSIACSQEVSYLWLLQRNEDLQAHLGNDTLIRILIAEYQYHDSMDDEQVDIRILWREPSEFGRYVIPIQSEEVFITCSPEFYQTHSSKLDTNDISDLLDLPHLQITKRYVNWMTWPSFYGNYGVRYETPVEGAVYSNYIYLLDAAAGGKGLALGWTGQIEKYIEQKRLLILNQFRASTKRSICVVINPDSYYEPAVQSAVEFFKSSAGSFV